MNVVYSFATDVTGKRLIEYMPKEFANLPLVLNHGNGEFAERRVPVLNEARAVRLCMDKYRQRKYFKQFSLTYLNLKKKEHVELCRLYLHAGVRLVMKGGMPMEVVGSTEKFDRWHSKYEFATVVEDKRFEYRILMFKGRAFRIMCKLNRHNNFQWKQSNSQFIDVPIDWFGWLYGSRLMKRLKRIVNKMGIDLCGIDLVRTKQGKFRILEINSGAAMCRKSIRLFYNMFAEMIGMEVKDDTKQSSTG